MDAKFILWYVVFAGLVALFAKGKGLSPIYYLVISLLLTPVLGFLSAVFTSPPKPKEVVLVHEVDPTPQVIESPSTSHVEALERLTKLKNEGALSEEEFEKEKKNILGL